MPEITDKAVEKIARLANLQVAPEDVPKFAEQLEKIVEYIHKLKELDTTNVPQTAHAMPVQNVWRDDVVVPGLTPGQALDQAPDIDDQGFRVPRIIE